MTPTPGAAAAAAADGAALDGTGLPWPAELPPRPASLQACLGGALADHADAAEAQLRAAGVQAGAIVAWLAHNRWEQLGLLLACERLGAVLLPLNWRLAAAELARIVQHAGAGHLLNGPEMQALADEVRQRAHLVPGPAAGIEPGDVMLVYTSGTTGQPKGALHTSAAMVANLVAGQIVQRLTAADRVLAVLPIFHVGGLCIQLLPALAAGAQVRLHERFNPDHWFDEVAQWRPSTTLLVPAAMRALIEHERWAQADLSSLAYLNCGSQVVPRHLIEAFHARGVRVTQVYGGTETGPVSIALPPWRALAHVGQVGWPAPGVQVRLAPDGQILLKAANLMRGYHRESQPSFDADGWFATGDLAVAHADGAVEVVGRSKELIISGGENIHPAEIEAIVLERPEVADCAVVALPDARWGEVPVLAVVLRAGRVLDEAALRAQFDDRLARFKHPRRVVVVDDLPRTALGKVQRPTLAKRLQA